MAPSALKLSSEEQIAYPYLFSKADTDQIGVLVGEKAVAFFAHSNLPPTILGEIWQLADQDNAGFLTRQQFDIALRLIGKAQRGLSINEQAISTPGPLCRLKGFSIPGLPNSSSPIPDSSTSLKATSIATSDVARDPLYTISNEDKIKYTRMFINAGPHDGLLDGDKARDIFIRSNLSFEKLGQIWTLADTQSRGALSVSDFCIAMHLIQLCMSRRLSTFPASLPSALLESATATVITTPVPNIAAAPSISRQVTGQPISHQVTGQAIPRQVTGQQVSSAAPLSAPNALRQSSIGSSIRPQYTGRSASGAPSILPTSIASNIGSPTALAWDISMAELAQSNVYFDSLDTNRLGYITGDKAVPFMMESKLPGEILARIWDLADIRGEGKLNREEFAIAMRLIQDTLAGGVESLMTKLPSSMLPPSSREAPLPAIPETSSTQQDLLSLMDDEPPNFTKEPSQNIEAAQVKPATVVAQASSLPTQLTGTHAAALGSRVASPPTLSQGNLTAQLTDRSYVPGLTEDSGAKLGNLVTQLTSTENALSTVRDERARLETETGNTAEQISTMQTKLSAVRQAYQTESPLVEELRKKQAEQRSIISQLTSDLITAESEFSSLKLEKEQIEGNILRDKEEVREMKKRMIQLEEDTQRLKLSLESLKKDSRLQKGLIAIGKKQVLTVEGQQHDISKEIGALNEQLHSIASEGSRESVPNIPAQTAISSHKSTNPFERMLSSTTAASLTANTPSPQPSNSRELHQPPQITGTQLGTSEDPFLSASHSSLQSQSTQSPDGLNFGDAFGLEGSDNRSFDEHGGFHDALETTSVPTTPNALPVKTSQLPTDTTEIAKSQQVIEHAEKKDESDDSSDEDEIEDPIARRLPLLSRSGESSSFIGDKFPSLEDVEASVESKAVSPPSSSEKQTVLGGDPQLSPAPPNESSPNREGEAADSRFDPDHSAATDKLSFSNDKSIQSNTNPIDFGDELEVSDFVSDFGPVKAKTSSTTEVGATLEDFDSAFENLPLPESKTSKAQEGVRMNDDKNKIATTADSTASSSGFDDGFDDAFAPMNKNNDGNKNKDQSTSIEFDESFSDFDEIFGGKSANNTNGQKGKIEQDPFGSPSSSSNEPPPLPTRPTDSTSKPHNDPTSESSPHPSKINSAKSTDSPAVQQICSMGFDRKVAIEALERDDWDMDRAINHLLGT